MNPLLKTLSIGAGGVAVVVAIYFGIGATTASNYPGAILSHLVDIVKGNQTNTVAAQNSPNWSFGQPLFTPIATSVATSSYGAATSGLASSTTWYFAVAALDGNGTTTISNTLSQKTDASTTQAYPEVINLKWSAVTGATGYAVYFSTSTPTLNNYFYATTTSFYGFATSTGSYAGANTQQDTTAYSTMINPLGSDWVSGWNTSATSSPTASSTSFQVNGAINVTAPATTTNCFAATAGQVFYNRANNHEWGCNGSSWTVIF